MKHIFFILLVLCSLCCFAQHTEEALQNIEVTINNLRVEGIEKTKENVVFGESKLTVGDKIKVLDLYKEFEKSKRNLLNTRLFNEAELSIEKWTDNNEVDIVFDVKERWYIYPIPIVELTGISFSEWKNDFNYDFDRVSYGMFGKHYNLTGRGDIATLVFKTGFQKQIMGSYILTGIDKKRNWGLGFKANYAENKGLSYKAIDNELTSYFFDGDDDVKFKSADVLLLRRKNINRIHGVSLGVNSVEVPNVVTEKLNPNYINELQQEYNTIAYGFNLEQRNLVDYPTEGYNFTGSMAYDGLFSDDLNTYTAFGQASYYHPINSKNFLSASINGRYLVDKDIPFYNLLRNAPDRDNLPRGYDGYRVFPKSYISFKSEYRYDLYENKFKNIPLIPRKFEPINFKILPKAYFDIGQTFSNQFVENNTLNNELMYSYGVGVDIVTIYNTPIVLEYGRNHLSENNLSFGLGKTF